MGRWVGMEGLKMRRSSGQGVRRNGRRIGKFMSTSTGIAEMLDRGHERSIFASRALEVFV